jgi:hypothetical protein
VDRHGEGDGTLVESSAGVGVAEPDPLLAEPEPMFAEPVIGCAECGAFLTEADARTRRWSYWMDGRNDDVYPYCLGCAERLFGRPR